MKKFKYFFLAIAFLLTLGSCRRADSNGKLDGFWKIYEIYYIADGITVNPESEFIAVQLELMQLQSNNPRYTLTGVLSYSKGADSFSVDFRSNTSPELLYNFGFGERQNTVHIDHLDNKKMILSTSVAQITCRKY